MIGSIVMIFILLFLTVGLVVSVRFVLRRVRDSVAEERAEGTTAESEEAVGRHALNELAAGYEPVYGDDAGPSTGRELKERYLRGEMTKAEYDRRLRAIQLDDFLKGRP